MIWQLATLPVAGELEHDGPFQPKPFPDSIIQFMSIRFFDSTGEGQVLKALQVLLAQKTLHGGPAEQKAK